MTAELETMWSLSGRGLGDASVGSPSVWHCWRIQAALLMCAEGWLQACSSLSDFLFSPVSFIPALGDKRFVSNYVCTLGPWLGSNRALGKIDNCDGSVWQPSGMFAFNLLWPCPGHLVAGVGLLALCRPELSSGC